MWKAAKLGDIYEFRQGIQVGKNLQKKILEKKTDVRFLRIIDFTQASEPPRYINFPGKKYLVNKNDVSLVRYGNPGFVCRGLQGAIANNLFKVIPKTSDICNEFLYWFLMSSLFQEKINIGKKGVAIQAISFGTIKDIKILFPPLAEQQHIVAKLDATIAEIDKGISQTQKLIENTNLLFEEKIKQYFIHNITNSPIVKLSDVSEYFNGLTYSPKDVSEDGIIVLRSGNIQNGKMKYQDIKRVKKKIKDKLYVKPTDILICSRNGSQRLIGKSSLIGEIKEPMTFGTFMMILRSEHNEYLQWFIKSRLFKKQILKGENTMINQITRYMLDDISLPFPDKKNYTKIAKELEELDGHIRTLNKILNIKIDNFKALQSSILEQELLDEVA